MAHVSRRQEVSAFDKENAARVRAALDHMSLKLGTGISAKQYVTADEVAAYAGGSRPVVLRLLRLICQQPGYEEKKIRAPGVVSKKPQYALGFRKLPEARSEAA